MTAGMTTRSMEGSRISLPRAGLGALLVGTLLAGCLLGAAVYAGITAATSSSAALSGALLAAPREPAAIRHARIEAGNGQLVGDTAGIKASVTAEDSPTRAIPYRGDGFGGDGFAVQPPIPYRGDGFGGDGFGSQASAGQTISHASGHGPLP